MEVWRCTYTQVPDDYVSPTPPLHTELTQSWRQTTDLVCCDCIFEQIDLIKKQVDEHAETYQIWIRGGRRERVKG